jgi:hypothetical protein
MGLAIAFNLLGACTDMCHPFVVHDISVKKAGEREKERERERDKPCNFDGPG